MEWRQLEWNGDSWNGMETVGMEWRQLEWNEDCWNGMETVGMEWRPDNSGIKITNDCNIKIRLIRKLQHPLLIDTRTVGMCLCMYCGRAPPPSPTTNTCFR